MGILSFSKEMYGTKAYKLCIKFLKKEHNASVSKPYLVGFVYQHSIEGDEIPKGEVSFYMTIKEIVPDVLAIKIER